MILGMKGELDVDKRKTTAAELLKIFLGVHPDHGVDGMTGQPAVMNSIAPQVEWPYVNNSEDVYQFATRRTATTTRAGHRPPGPSGLGERTSTRRPDSRD